MIAEAALGSGESHAMLYRLAALDRQQKGDFHGAAQFLLSAVQLSPDDTDVLAAAADALRHVGQLEKSIELFDRALARDGGLVAAWYGRGLALESAGALETARQSYQRVTELAPDTAPGWAGLSTITAQLGHKDDARRYAVQAHQLSSNDPTACMALARCEMTDGNDAHAVQLLRQTSLDQVDLLTLLGDALDRLGQLDDAFVAYTNANARFAAVHNIAEAASATRDRVENIERAVANLQPDSWKTSQCRASGTAARHIFLLGYPRSGTTLVEQSLASLPNVVAIEEMPTLDDAVSLLSEEGVARLASMPEDEANTLRDAYWRRVTATGIEVAGKIFVDMDPSKSVGLPLIARLFPDAKIVIMRRDPRDVVWSCFRRAFAYNAVTMEFYSLLRTALHYAAVRRLTQACVQSLPIDAHTVVYEQLVNDFDATTQNLCRFLDIPWSVAMRDFGSAARSGRVKTASAAQVRRTLFDGTGQWRNYADRLEPVLRILQPWIDER